MTGIFQILLAGQGAPTILADYLVVAGGGGGGFGNGGFSGGAGGAGGYREFASQSLVIGTAFTVTVIIALGLSSPAAFF